MMEWTQEMPTTEGWCWTYHPVGGVYIYLLREGRDSHLWTDESGEYDRRIDRMPDGTMWLGPIKEPEIP